MTLKPTQQSTAHPSVDSLHISVEHTHQKPLPSLLALTNDRIEADHKAPACAAASHPAAAAPHISRLLGCNNHR